MKFNLFHYLDCLLRKRGHNFVFSRSQSSRLTCTRCGWRRPY